LKLRRLKRATSVESVASQRQFMHPIGALQCTLAAHGTLADRGVVHGTGIFVAQMLLELPKLTIWSTFESSPQEPPACLPQTCPMFDLAD
jgi:hypothetical protein